MMQHMISIGAMDSETISKAKTQMNKTIDSVGDQTLKSMGIAYASSCDKAAGINVDKVQKAYLWYCGRRMFVMAAIMLIAAAIISYFAAKVGAGVGRDMRGTVFRNVMNFSNAEMDQFSTASLITRSTNDVQQIQLVTTMMLRMVLYAPILGIWGIIKVAQTGAHMGWVIALAVCMRFYDVNSGSIMLDGHDIRDFNRHDLRENFGMVLQDTWLYSGTIMENIRYGRLDATDEEVIEAAKAAHADHFIRTLPGGYNMVLNEDASNVSQGQKQLLTIARAILADNKVMILDEATSSVDTRTEELIQSAMDNLMHGRTSFIIAHRLSTIRNADLILVMNHGDIIEQGNHEELLSQGGFYADLYNSQFEEAS